MTDVEQLRFGPESDNYCQALRIALQHMGETAGYPEISTWSGRAFSTCFNEQYFYWDRHLSAPDPDAEGYLRSAYPSARAAIERLGYEGDLLVPADCLHPEPESNLTVADTESLRSALCSGIDAGRPLLAHFSLSAAHWAPEWCLFTGYDEAGATAIGWSCFQQDEQQMLGLDTEPGGQFRTSDWDARTPCLIKIEGHPGADRDLRALEHQAAADAVEQAQNRPTGNNSTPHLSWGLAAFDGWAAAIEDPDNAQVTDEVLLGRMQYHGHLVGHLAAQKWYSSAALRGGSHSPWTVADVLQAAAAYATFHEQMWDIWQIAGGYWRDEQEELVKFRAQDARERIATLIRQARALDERAVTHLQQALDRWDKSHGDYVNH